MAAQPFPTPLEAAGLCAWSDTLHLRSRAPMQFLDLTPRIAHCVRQSRVEHGLVNVQCLHTSAALLVNENEPLLLEDFAALLERWAPRDARWQHDRWNRHQTSDWRYRWYFSGGGCPVFLGSRCIPPIRAIVSPDLSVRESETHGQSTQGQIRRICTGFYASIRVGQTNHVEPVQGEEKGCSVFCSGRLDPCMLRTVARLPDGKRYP